MSQTFTSDIVNLNVGGSRFSTSRQTLSLTPDSFFTSMLSGRIPTCRDETGALFIDRDPKLFSIILHFLRTKELDLNGVDISVLRHEAEFYGVTPLVKRLMLCEDLDRSLCGDVLFTGFIHAPQIPLSSMSSAASSTAFSTPTPHARVLANASTCNQAVNVLQTNTNISSTTTTTQPMPSINSINKPLNMNSNSNNAVKPGNVLRLGTAASTASDQAANNKSAPSTSGQQLNHSRNPSLDLVSTSVRTGKSPCQANRSFSYGSNSTSQCPNSTSTIRATSPWSLSRSRPI